MGRADGGRRVSTAPVVDIPATETYIVHMKYVTASEARKNWFRLLDEAAAGEVIAIERNDKRLILRAEKRRKPGAPRYKGLIGGAGLDDADKWSWDWTPSRGLVPIIRK
jgi:hypothetical protein